jgi:hypothetical protein
MFFAIFTICSFLSKRGSIANFIGATFLLNLATTLVCFLHLGSKYSSSSYASSIAVNIALVSHQEGSITQGINLFQVLGSEYCISCPENFICCLRS